MENVTQIFYLIFLAIVICITIFNWLYAMEVQKVKGLEGFIFPNAVEKMLRINLFLPILVAIIITFLFFFGL